MTRGNSADDHGAPEAVADLDLTNLTAPVTMGHMLATGATYRRLDHWSRAGWIEPTREHTSRPHGAGNPRRWTVRDYRIAGLIVRLTAAGMEAPAAAEAARLAVDEGHSTITLPGGITIGWAA